MSEFKRVNIAVIGSGAPVHAICWKLDQSPKVKSIFAIPGNAGTRLCMKVTNHNIRLNAEDGFQNLVRWLKRNKVEWVIVGDVNLLAADIAGSIESNSGIKCFGPTATGAKIETDKQWAKQFTSNHGMPTAEGSSFPLTDLELAKLTIQYSPSKLTVVKARGFLPDSKDVIVSDDVWDAQAAVNNLAKLEAAAGGIIVEKRLHGQTVSIAAFSDGYHAEVMLPVNVKKKLKNKDKGPNTGGMGAFCPYPINEDHMRIIKKYIMQRFVDEFFLAESVRFVGVFCAEIMITEDGMKVLGFKCTFGDPEAQVLIPLLDCDLFQIIQDCCTAGFKNKTNAPVKWKKTLSCVGVMKVSKDYCLKNERSRDIGSLIKVDYSKYKRQPDVYLFHGNTCVDEGYVKSPGGRMFSCVAVDTNLIRASARATNTLKKVKTNHSSRLRTDIGWNGFYRHVPCTIQSANVDVTTRDDFIKTIRDEMKSSHFEYDIEHFDHKRYDWTYTCDTVVDKWNTAKFCQNFTTIGEDLVAKCVNSILEKGAKPYLFHGYVGYGMQNENIARDVVSSIIKAYERTKSAKYDGGIYKMSEFYKDDEYTLAGFILGIIRKEKKAFPQSITEGDRIIYLSSSGIHLNGHSIVRKILSDYSPEDLKTRAPFSRNKQSYAENLLIPTKNYAKQVLPLIKKGLIKAFLPISDGGLVGSIGKIIPPHHEVELDAFMWDIPPIFGWIAAKGSINEQEMLGTFNCGVGAVVIVDNNPKTVADVVITLKTKVIGEIVRMKDGELFSDAPPVRVKNWQKALSGLLRRDITQMLVSSPVHANYKRVAVLLSHPGTYLKDLIECTTKDPISPAAVKLVIAHQPDHVEIEIAQNYGIPVKVVKIGKDTSPHLRDNAIMKALEDLENPIDIICFTGFTGLLSPGFVEKFKGQMINIHHSLLPAFDEESPEKQALEAGVKFTGCTVYFAQAEVRAGQRSPLDIIDQRIVPVYPNDDNETTLRERIREQGREIFPRALILVAAEKVKRRAISSTDDRNLPGPSRLAGAERIECVCVPPELKV